MQQQRTKEILLKRISFQWGVISLLSVALFFVLQIISAEAYDNTANPLVVTSEEVSANVKVEENKAIHSVPESFMGFSLEPNNVEPNNICYFMKAVSSNPKIEQEFKNLGSGVVRVGGSSGDKITWQPNGSVACDSTGTYNRQVVDDFFAFVKKVGWKAIWQVSLGDKDNPETYADEASYVYKAGGSSLLGIEIGNEPEGFVSRKLRAEGYNYSDYKSEWEKYKNAIKAKGNIPVIGPDSWSMFKDFATDESKNVKALTLHYYPTKVGGGGTAGDATIESLLSKSLMSKSMSDIKTKMSYSNGTAFILGETNSASGGGQNGMSNTMAAALWGADYMFSSLEQGVSGMNFHGVVSAAKYAPVAPDGTPMALYYGMLLFHNAAPDGKAVFSSASSSANVVSHAILGKDGKLKVVVINKDLSKDASVKVSTQKAYTAASALYLSAPSISSTSGFTYGGNAVASDGTWKAGASKAVTVDGNSAYISVPSGSAAVITFEKAVSIAKYALAVKNGTGSGSYAANTKVEITANTVSGKTFDKWTGDTKYVSDASSASAVVTMPAKAVTLTATYKSVSSLKIAQLNIFLNGNTVRVRPGNTGVIFQQIRLKNNLNKAAVIKVNSFEMESSVANSSVDSVANFSALYLYLNNKQIGKATITGGKAGFDTVVSIPAGSSASLVLRGDVSASAVSQSIKITKINYEEGVISGGISTSTPTALSGNYSTIKITAATTYTLTVKNGTGSGSYTANTKVEIAANPAISEKVFDKWTGDTRYLADPASAKTTITMPNKAVTVVASYKDSGAVAQTQSLKATILKNDATVEKGATGVKLIEATLANTGTETLTVSGLGIMADFGASYFTNPVLYIDGKEIGKPDKTKSYEAIYKSLSISIESGKSATIMLKADVSSKLNRKARTIRLDSCTNVFTVKGATTNKKARITMVNNKAYVYFAQ